jgi:hypothetical protein
MRYSKGICWLDDTRIPFTEDGGWGKRHNQEYPEWKGAKNFTHGEQHLEQNDKGRFTPNLLVCDDMLNDGSVSKSTIFDGKLPNIKGGRFGAIDIELTDKRAFGGFNDSGSSSRYYDLDKWFDKVIDEIQ